MLNEMHKYLMSEEINLGERAMRIVANFSDPSTAKQACDRIRALLEEAKRETDELFVRQNGFAESGDVADIYARYGFRNDVGWHQERSLVAEGDVLLWETPSGLRLEEAQTVLLAFGAQAVAAQALDDDEPWRFSSHPMAMPLSDEDIELLDSFIDEEDDGGIVEIVTSKKLLH